MAVTNLEEVDVSRHLIKIDQYSLSDSDWQIRDKIIKLFCACILFPVYVVDDLLLDACAETQLRVQFFDDFHFLLVISFLLVFIRDERG